MREIVYKYLDHLYYIQGKYILFKESNSYVEEFWPEVEKHQFIFDLSLREYKEILKAWVKSHNPEFNLISIHPVLNYHNFRWYLSDSKFDLNPFNPFSTDTSKFGINEIRVWNSICFNFIRISQNRIVINPANHERDSCILELYKESIIDY